MNESRGGSRSTSCDRPGDDMLSMSRQDWVLRNAIFGKWLFVAKSRFREEDLSRPGAAT